MEDYRANVPYPDVEKFVSSDLSEYGQDTLCPISKTIVLPDGSFRHYELGPIMGYVLFGNKDDKYGLKTFISEVEEDDEYWFAPSLPMYMAGAWINSVNNTFNRMATWYKEHIFEGFENGKWVAKVLKPIENEEKFREDGLTASPVLEGPQV
jgi:hypothetical protein